MLNTSQAERPDPGFVEHLEWELARAVRREARFGGSSQRAPRRVGRLAVALLLAVTVGASGVVGAQQLRRSQAADLLAEQYRVRLEIAALHADGTREELQRAETAHASGVVSAPELAEVRDRATDAAHAIALVRLDAEEVAVTGREPDRRLSAPLVAGRDLVTLRIDEDLRRMRPRATLAAEHAERVALLHESGRASQQELDDARHRRDGLEDQIASLLARRALRAGFLASEHDAVRTELLGLQADGNARLAQAQRALAAASTAFERTRVLADNGRATSKEARQAELAVQAAEFELRLVEAELSTLAARLDEAR